MTDQLQKFMFDAAPIRGELVSLQATWQEVQQRSDYPTPVRHLLGEMLAAAALLSANIKFQGTLIMQIHGDGPVQMLVVECHSDLRMRATAKLSVDAIIPDNASLHNLLNVQGQGRFAITLDPSDKKPGQQPYQGMVPLSDENGPLPTMAAILEHYMRASEQLDTRIWLAANRTHAAGMLLQRLPDEGGKTMAAPIDEDAWFRLCSLSATLTDQELLELPPQDILRRLFLRESEENGVRVFDPLGVSFSCTCSRQRVGAMLHMLGAEEIASILSEREIVEIRCDFCSQRYVFDAVDCAQLFSTPTLAQGMQTPPTQRH